MSSHTPTRTVRAFTLLEVVLASVLGVVVITTCIGVFAAIDRSHRRQEQRLDETLQFARAHQTIERALQNVVMVEARPPESELDDRFKEQARLIDEGRDLPVDSTSRFTLRKDPFDSGALPFTRQQAVYSMRPQVLELAVRSSPVFGGEVQPDAAFSTRTVAHGSARADDRRHDRRGQSDFTPATRRSDGGTQGDLQPSDSASDPLSLDYNIDDAARAPGVRGVFELRPDGEIPGAAVAQPAGARAPVSPVRPPSSDSSGQRGWTLWWRELPHRDPVVNSPSQDALSGAALPKTDDDHTPPTAETSGDSSRRAQSGDSRASRDFLVEAGDEALRRVPLVSGLKSCRWEAYRRDRQDADFSATYEAELPSYVSLELESLSGRRENWMFEIGWSDGPEPGEIMVNGAAAGGGDLSGLIGGGPAGAGNGAGGAGSTGDKGGTGGATGTTGGVGGTGPTGSGKPGPTPAGKPPPTSSGKPNARPRGLGSPGIGNRPG